LVRHESSSRTSSVRLFFVANNFPAAPTRDDRRRAGQSRCAPGR
jgi:hypothetical protein